MSVGLCWNASGMCRWGRTVHYYFNCCALGCRGSDQTVHTSGRTSLSMLPKYFSSVYVAVPLLFHKLCCCFALPFMLIAQFVVTCSTCCFDFVAVGVNMCVLYTCEPVAGVYSSPATLLNAFSFF